MNQAPRKDPTTAWKELREWLVSSGVLAPPPPPRKDRRQYALWARKNRNTGPAKPHNGNKP